MQPMVASHVAYFSMTVHVLRRSCHHRSNTSIIPILSPSLLPNQIEIFNAKLVTCCVGMSGTIDAKNATVLGCISLALYCPPLSNLKVRFSISSTDILCHSVRPMISIAVYVGNPSQVLPMFVTLAFPRSSARIFTFMVHVLSSHDKSAIPSIHSILLPYSTTKIFKNAMPVASLTLIIIP